MKIRSLFVAGALALTGLSVAAPMAHADEVPAPVEVTGTYKLSATTVYLVPNAAGTARSASVTLSQVSISDPTATRTVVDGAGGASVNWPTGTSLKLTYTKAGTFPVKVGLSTDTSSGLASVGTVTVKLDTIKPTVKISLPSKASKVGSWKVIRGTAADVGTGVAFAGVFVMQKRGAYWYAYDFAKRKWIKGFTSLKKTGDKSKATPAFVPVTRGSWKSPTIKGLRKGKIVVQALAVDAEINMGSKQLGPRTLR